MLISKVSQVSRNLQWQHFSWVANNPSWVELFFTFRAVCLNQVETVLFESKRGLWSNFSSAYFLFHPQVPHPSDWHLRHWACLQPRGVRHPARLQDQLGILEPPRPAVHDHVPYVGFIFSNTDIYWSCICLWEMVCINSQRWYQNHGEFWFMFVCVCVTESASRLCEFIKSSDRNRRDFGATNRSENSFRAAGPKQMPISTCCDQAPHRNVQTHTSNHGTFGEIGDRRNFSCLCSLQLIQRQSAAPAVSKILAVITKPDTVKDVSFHLGVWKLTEKYCFFLLPTWHLPTVIDFLCVCHHSSWCFVYWKL